MYFLYIIEVKSTLSFRGMASLVEINRDGYVHTVLQTSVQVYRLKIFERAGHVSVPSYTVYVWEKPMLCLPAACLSFHCSEHT